MTQVQVLDAVRDRPGGYKVDVNRGERVGRVSSEWFSRPADERYLSLSDLFAAVRERTERSRNRTVQSAAIRVVYRRLQPARRHHPGHDDALRLRSRRLPVPGRRPQSD